MQYSFTGIRTGIVQVFNIRVRLCDISLCDLSSYHIFNLSRYSIFGVPELHPARQSNKSHCIVDTHIHVVWVWVCAILLFLSLKDNPSQYRSLCRSLLSASAPPCLILHPLLQAYIVSRQLVFTNPKAKTVTRGQTKLTLLICSPHQSIW